MKLPRCKILYCEDEIKRRVKALGAEITKQYDDGKPLVCVCVLRGAVMFFTDLMKEIDSENVVYDFVTLSSYETAMVEGTMATTGKVKLIHDLRENVEGKHVLVVEDIVDSGYTIDYIRKYFATKKPLDIRVACLLDKPKSRKVEAYADYIAFTLSYSPYIIGYGLDSDQKFRNLNAIYEVITV